MTPMGIEPITPCIVQTSSCEATCWELYHKVNWLQTILALQLSKIDYAVEYKLTAKFNFTR